MKIGVLALQGAVREHLSALEKCGVQAISVKKPAQLDGLDGLIIPGGESTTVGKLMVKYGFIEKIKEKAAAGMAVFGTCTGLILLAKRITNSEQPLIGLMDITVNRNAFGRQIDSFETDLEVKGFTEPFHAVFIRAPYITGSEPGVEVLGKIGEKIVLARQENMLAAAFHPELTDDLRIHKLFIEMCSN